MKRFLVGSVFVGQITTYTGVLAILALRRGSRRGERQSRDGPEMRKMKIITFDAWQTGKLGTGWLQKRTGKLRKRGWKLES